VRSTDLTGYGLGAEATEILGAYLSTLDSYLPVGRRTRARILAELADGLACAVEASIADGVPSATAAREAVAESGDPRHLAAQFAGQMLAVTTQRTGTALVLSGPAVGLLWAGWFGAGLPNWVAKATAAVTQVPVLPVILVAAIPCAVFAASAGGRLGRVVTVPARWTYRAALLATAGCVAADAILVGEGLAQAGAASAWLVLALMASILRMGMACWATTGLVRQHAAAS
jgi:hypothetical protein